ncbi:MAG: GreA/GreB family elongation factor [Chitinophagaceae bacterium]|nr:GreA/GreB family elongation factor [Chitinophagaceae bacterium]
MSRGFVKEEDQEEIPVIPPRAALPDGVPNYVTQSGYEALLQEKTALEEERRNLPSENEGERRRSALFIDGKLKLLLERIASARILDTKSQSPDEVRFGATVEFFNGKKNLCYQIVGADEADIKKKKIAFTAPIARSLIGKKINETANFKLGNQIQKLKILKISYL